MTVLEYYKKYLNEDVVNVEKIFCSMNLTDETFGNEFYDRVTYSNGAQEYYFSTFEYGHSLLSPEWFPDQWLGIAQFGESDYANTEIPEEVIPDILSGKGW